jgi:hypothetical protein
MTRSFSINNVAIENVFAKFEDGYFINNFT